MLDFVSANFEGRSIHFGTSGLHEADDFCSMTAWRTVIIQMERCEQSYLTMTPLASEA